MLMNLQGPVLAFQQPGGVTVFRRSLAAVVNGRQRENPPTQLSIKACVQPLTGKQLLALPEGERTKEWIVVFAVDAATPPLQIADVQSGQLSDRVQFGGRVYEVMRLNTWAPIGGFWSAECAKVGQ